MRKSTHIDDPKRLGRRVREARDSAGLSQRQLAFPGCSAAYVSQIEAGIRTPSLQVVRELARRLGVSEAYLTGDAADGAVEQTLLEAEVAFRLADSQQADRLYRRAIVEAAGPAERARALSGLGQLALQDGRPHEAIELLEEALELVEEPEVEQPAAVDALGRSYATVGRFELAIALFERALGKAAARADFVERLRFGVLLANALVDAGRFGRADEILGDTLAVAQESADPLVRARLFWSQSRLHSARNDPETAERYARKVLEILELGEYDEYTAQAYQLLAHIQVDRGDPEDALLSIEKGTRLLGTEGHPVVRAQLMLDEARALAALGRHEEAVGTALQAAGLFADVDPVDAGRGYLLVAEIYTELGERQRAVELYELAVELLQTVPTRFLVEAYRGLAGLLEAEGHTQDALDLLKQAVRVQQEAGRAL